MQHTKGRLGPPIMSYVVSIGTESLLLTSAYLLIVILSSVINRDKSSLRVAVMLTKWMVSAPCQLVLI